MTVEATPLDEETERRLIQIMYDATGLFGFDHEITKGKKGISAGEKIQRLILADMRRLGATPSTSSARILTDMLIRTMLRDLIAEGFQESKNKNS